MSPSFQIIKPLYLFETLSLLMCFPIKIYCFDFNYCAEMVKTLGGIPPYFSKKDFCHSYCYWWISKTEILKKNVKIVYVIGLTVVVF